MQPAIQPPLQPLPHGFTAKLPQKPYTSTKHQYNFDAQPVNGILKNPQPLPPGVHVNNLARSRTVNFATSATVKNRTPESSWSK